MPFASLANVVAPVAYNKSPAVYDVKFVPPLATTNCADNPAANVALPAAGIALAGNQRQGTVGGEVSRAAGGVGQAVTGGGGRGVWLL